MFGIEKIHFLIIARRLFSFVSNTTQAAVNTRFPKFSFLRYSTRISWSVNSIFKLDIHSFENDFDLKWILYYRVCELLNDSFYFQVFAVLHSLYDQSDISFKCKKNLSVIAK